MVLIRKLKKTYLVQDEETMFIYHVPVEFYNEDGDYSDHLIPYSLSFSDILDAVIDTNKIEVGLHTAGIHTFDDVLANRKRVNDLLKQHISTDIIIKEIKGDN